MIVSVLFVYPSFPVIQTLVKCILVPQMTYGFPFFKVEDKVVSTGRVKGLSDGSRGNLYVRMKNAMLRPLLFSLGLPHLVNHASVFIESRVFLVCGVTLKHSSPWTRK